MSNRCDCRPDFAAMDKARTKKAEGIEDKKADSSQQQKDQESTGESIKETTKISE